MKSNRFPILMLFIAAAGCSRSEPENAPSGNQAVPHQAVPSQSPSAPAPQAPSAPPPATNLPEDRTPLPEPKGPIDPKSAEAAGQVVQHYGALIEQKRWTESWELWSNAAAAKAFDRSWRNASAVHMEVGKPGDMEGAAGSSYVTVPVVFYGKTNAGKAFRRGANVILRRVNDVPGSTEAQRRWHIERIDWKGAD